jgi:hypothetical protein
MKQRWKWRLQLISFLKKKVFDRLVSNKPPPLGGFVVELLVGLFAFWGSPRTL